MYLHVFIPLLLRGILGGYYEGNMMVRYRSVDTPGQGGGMGPIHIPRVEILTRGSLSTAIVHYGR